MPAVGFKHSAETKAKMSRAHKGRVKTPEECANISAGKKRQHALKPIEVPPEALEAARRANVGNKHAVGHRYTSEQLARRGQITSQRWMSGVYDNKGIPTRGKPGVHAGIKMRCLNSEGVFARELDRAGIKWIYEPRRFQLSWCTYLPDFYLPEYDLWVEVKGYMTEQAQSKIDSFRSETGKTLVVVFCKELPYRSYKDGDKN